MKSYPINATPSLTYADAWPKPNGKHALDLSRTFLICGGNWRIALLIPKNDSTALKAFLTKLSCWYSLIYWKNTHYFKNQIEINEKKTKKKLTNASFKAFTKSFAGIDNNFFACDGVVLHTSELIFSFNGKSATGPVGKNLCHAVLLSSDYNIKFEEIFFVLKISLYFMRQLYILHLILKLQLNPFDHN